MKVVVTMKRGSVNSRNLEYALEKAINKLLLESNQLVRNDPSGHDKLYVLQVSLITTFCPVIRPTTEFLRQLPFVFFNVVLMVFLYCWM